MVHRIIPFKGGVILKKYLLILAAVVLLTGCGQPEEYETVMDSQVEQTAAEKMEIVLNLPGESAKPVMASEDDEQFYVCDQYTLSLRTAPGGDLQKTVLQACGFLPEQLSVMETVQGDAKRYDFVWTAAGETGEQVGRCAILDDGGYHYVVTAMADASVSGMLTGGDWREIFNSFRILPAEEVVSSGS